MIKKILLLGLFLMNLSCALFSKKVESSHTKEVLKIENKRFDSVTAISKTLPIYDVFNVSLKTNDPSIDSIINLRLKDFSIVKSSGKNSASIKYNPENVGLEITTKVASSENKEIQSSRKATTENSEKQSSKKNTTKTNNFSWWLYILIAVSVFVIIKIRKKIWFLKMF